MSRLEDKERVRTAIIKAMGRSKFLYPKTLIQKISEHEQVGNLGTLAILDALAELARDKWVTGIAINTGKPTGQVVIIGDRPTIYEPLSLTRWKSAMSGMGLSVEEQEILAPCHVKLHDMTEDDMCLLIGGLVKLKSEQLANKGMPKFVVSAKYLMAASKILDALPAKALRNFGIELKLFTEHPSYVVVAGYRRPKAVLLIENPHAFEVAAESKVIDDVAMIATFGYGLSRTDDSFGNQMAEIIESGKVLIPLIRKGNPPSLDELFAHENIFFWGDYDAEGIRIFERLKAKLPKLKLSGLTRVMEELASQPASSHPYVAIAGKDKQENPNAQSRAVDQEFITAAQIEKIFGLINLNE